MESVSFASQQLSHQPRSSFCPAAVNGFTVDRSRVCCWPSNVASFCTNLDTSFHSVLSMSMKKISTVLLTITILANCQHPPVQAASVLGFASVGSTSHQASLGTIGLELVRRGHSFTLLLSSRDELSHSRLAHEPFNVLDVMNFSGPSVIGTQEWRENIPRDPAKARRAS